MQNIGKMMAITGVIILAAGLIIWLLGDKTSWFGNLPGDIKIRRQNFVFYAPVVSMLLLSIFISLVFWLIKKLF